jgi:hypothetical protein
MVRAFLTSVIFVVLAVGSAWSMPVIRHEAGFILSAADAPKLLKQCSRSAPANVTGSWLPTDAQVRELETRLPAALSQVVAKRVIKPVHWPTSDFGRQYGGLVVGKRRIIYVNAFPGDEDEKIARAIRGWRIPDRHKELFLVCDGGPDFFGVEYDPNLKTFANFEFNGAI